MEREAKADETAGGYDPEAQIRPELVDMAPYKPIVPLDVLASRLGMDIDEIVKLDANENPYGPAPSVNAAISNAALHIYPDPESTELRSLLSDYTGLPMEYIFTGAGADEIIDLLFRLFVSPDDGDAVMNAPPTFGMYKFDADVNGARVLVVPRREDFSIDVDAMVRTFEQEEKPPKMIFLASPNNPDGSTVSDEDLERLLALPTLIVLDEAYWEFSKKTRIGMVPTRCNLVVLRTFSKWAGLAGMRVGYAGIPLEIIKHLWKVKQPYNVSVAGQAAAIESIRNSKALMQTVDLLLEQRDRFYKRVGAFDWLLPYPSHSNYVLCRVGGGRVAGEVKAILAKRGVLVRYYDAPGVANCIRVSMGTEKQMERLYEELATL